jgi:hypothetical protein
MKKYNPSMEDILARTKSIVSCVETRDSIVLTYEQRLVCYSIARATLINDCQCKVIINI